MSSKSESQRVYLDTAATEKLLPCARAAMVSVMDASTGNAAALHSEGHYAHELIEDARAKVAHLINAKPEEIIFTSGGTEANNAIIETYRDKNIAVSAIEHPSVLRAAQARAKKCMVVPVDRYGFIESERFDYSDSDLVSIMLANNELGTIEPVEKVVSYCRRHNNGRHIYYHTDATQAVSKMKVDVRELGVDYLSLSAHKIGGPIGVGALYVKKGAPFRPLLLGGKQEGGRRAGTSNLLGIVGFGAAAAWCHECQSYKKWMQVAELRDELRERILRDVPYSSCNSPQENCLPHILNMSFQAAEGESVQLYLDAEGIAVSTGSACAAGDIKPSHVLMATHGDAEVAHSSIRFALGLDTALADITRVMEVLPNIIKRLQGMSTVNIGTRYERNQNRSGA